MLPTCLLCLLPGLLALASAKEIQFEPCAGQIKSVDVSPCSSEPCEIPKGEAAIISVKCIPNMRSEKLRLTVWASVGGIEVPYPGMKRDACVGKNITCPIEKGQEFTMVQQFPVKKFFPTIETVARFNLKAMDDPQERSVCCFKAPVKVVPARK